jgi:hypothetical protein
MITTILIVAVLLAVALIAVVATRPDDFRVTRSLSIAAPASVLFEQVNDLRLWEAWSPWIKMEPDVKKIFTGPSSGIGASYSWEGKKTGSGKMTTIECRPNDLLRFDLHFEKPFKAQNVAEFTFKPEAGETIVTWSMNGKNNFAGKAFSLFVNCDKMIGSQFALGLQNLKTVTEETVPA